MARPPRVQITSGIRAIETRAPAEFLCHARDQGLDEARRGQQRVALEIDHQIRIVELAELLVQRTAYARSALHGLDGVEPLHSQPVVREFAVRLDAPVDKVISRCLARGVNPGYALERDDPELRGGLLVAITEQRSRSDIDRLVEVLGAAVAAERSAVEARA